MGRLGEQRQARLAPRLGVVVCLSVLASSCGGDDGRGANAGDDRQAVDQSAPAASTTIVAAGDGTADGATHEAGDPGSFYLRAADQLSDGRSIVVDEVVLSGTNGWVVVHSQTAGSLGAVIGHSQQLPPGTSTDVRIAFTDPPIASRATVYPMLHVETTGDGDFDFPDGDNAASSADGNVVVFPLVVEFE